MIALTLEGAWWHNYGPIIRPDFFENTAEVALVTGLNKFHEQYNRPPHLDELLAYLPKLNLKTELHAEVNDLASTVYAGADTWELDFARTNVLEFAHNQALKLAMLEAIDRIEDGKTEGIDRLISDANDIGLPKEQSIRLVRDTNTWLSSIAYEERIPTGIFHADAMMEGGASRGDLGVIIAPPNYGKSMALVNIGFGAAGVTSHSNVAHVTLEIKEDKIAKRYAARTAFNWYNPTFTVEEYRDKFLKAAKRRIAGDIDIYGAPPGIVSVDMLRRYLDKLDRDGFTVDCLIVDYADEMKLPRGDTAFEQHGENYRQLKTLAREYDIVVWTASQTNRASVRKITIDMDDMADSFKKAARADIILAWCQTPEEEEASSARLFCAKYRDGIKHWYVVCKIHNESHALVSTDVIWASDLVKKAKEG